MSQVILYQSIEDGSIALKADDDIYEDKGYYKDFYTDTEILSGVSFKMKWVKLPHFCVSFKMKWVKLPDFCVSPETKFPDFWQHSDSHGLTINSLSCFGSLTM